MMDEVGKVTEQVIKRLDRDGNPNKAVLASLRNATTITSPQAQPIWPVLMANLYKNQLSSDGAPTPAEVAIYTAIRFYAIYQQSQEQPVHSSADEQGNKRIELFAAFAKLREIPDNRDALDRRVQSVLATINVRSVINSLSHLLKILKASDKMIKIDYAQLAKDLYRLQGNYKQANQVRLHWGEQYFWIEQEKVETKGDQN